MASNQPGGKSASRCKPPNLRFPRRPVRTPPVYQSWARRAIALAATTRSSLPLFLSNFRPMPFSLGWHHFCFWSRKMCLLTRPFAGRGCLRQIQLDSPRRQNLPGLLWQELASTRDREGGKPPNLCFQSARPDYQMKQMSELRTNNYLEK